MTSWISKILKFDFLENEKGFWSEINVSLDINSYCDTFVGRDSNVGYPNKSKQSCMAKHLIFTC